MKLIVNPHKVDIVKEPVNEREIDITKCEFEFADEITSDYVKEAYFTFNGQTYKQIIVNNQCDIPSEVLTKKGQVELGVVAFLVENETEIKRYNPSPAYFETWLGSLKDNAENSEPITPSEMEQFEQALQDGLEEVNDKLDDINQALDDVNTAIEETNNLDLDVSKSGKTATVTLTKKDATTKTVTLSDGTSLMFNWDGTKLGIKTDEDEDYTYVDLQGVQGPIGPKGEAFTIKKTYSSVAEMNADFYNMQLGDYVMIASTVEVEDNAKLYTRGESQWIFISDFSGATGIKGETGATPNIQIGAVVSGTTPSVTRTGTNENPILNFVLQKGDTGSTGPQGETGATGNGIASITKTSTSGLVDTYTITYTNGTTSTFQITNGEDGEVTQEQYDELEDRVQDLERNQKTGEATGAEIDLTDAFDTRPRYLGIDAKETKQVTTTGKQLFDNSKVEIGKSWHGGNNANRARFYMELPVGTEYSIRVDDFTNITSIAILETTSITTATGGTAIYTLTKTEPFTMTHVFSNDAIYLAIQFESSSTFTREMANSIKLMLNLGSTALDYEPYTGGQPSPSPEFPQDVETMVGIRNLFDKNNINWYRNNDSDYDAQYNSNPIRISSTGINITGGKTYTVSGFPNEVTLISIRTYNVPSGVSTEQVTRVGKVFSIPEDVNYIRLLFSGENFTNKTNELMKNANIIITEGAEEKPYVPYGTNYMVLDEVGKNLFSSEIELGSINNTTGENVTSTTVVRAKDYIKVLPNTTYILSNNLGYYYYVYQYDENNTFISYSSQTNGNPYTFTTTSTTKYIRLRTNATATQNDTSVKYQLEQGSTATSYEPYQHKQYPISLANQELLNKNDYVDKIIVDESTGESYIEKLWGKIVLDGSEDWRDRPSYSYADRFVLGNIFPITSASVLCNYFITKIGASDNTYPYLAHNGDQCIVNFSEKGTASLTQFKEWLSTHNTIVYYPLTTPEIIPIDNPNIKLLNGVNHITNSEGAEMDIVYVKDINTYLDSINARIEALENANEI